MDTLSSKIEGIEMKVRQMALILERLRKENKRLAEDNSTLRNNLAKHSNKTSDLENKLEKTSLALEVKKENDPERSKKLRKEIEQYIKEIDRCIDRLKNS